MFRSISSRLRRTLGAHAVGFVALFVALAGPAGAAAIITSNSQVGPGVIAGVNGFAGSTDNVIGRSIAGKDLAASAVGAAQLATNAVTGAQIANGTVRTADLGTGSVMSAQLGPGAVGPAALAHHAVTAYRLGSDVRRRIAISLTPTGGQYSYDDVVLGSLDLYQQCTVSTGGPAQMWLTPSNLDSANTGELDLSGIAQSPGGAPRLVLNSATVAPGSAQPVLAGVSDEQGTGTLVWRIGTQVYQGTIHWLVDPTHCELSGVLMASHS